MQPKHPTQPVVIDPTGVHRFKANKIVRALLDAASEGKKLDLNIISTLPFDTEDRVQLAQLIGYSVAGFADLSYVDDEAYEAAVVEQNKMKAREGID